VKTYVGTVEAVYDSRVLMRVNGAPVELRAAMRTSLDAIPLIGQRVRFTAALSEHTACVTKPVLCIGSEYGLVPVAYNAP